MLWDKWRGLLLLAGIHASFFWKITLSDQFSFLIHWDNANQVFPWTQFVVRSLAHSNLPLWDAYSFAGRSFVGEMQTGLFNPLSIPLYAAGWIAGGAIEPRWIDLFVVGCHLLGCWFFYSLARRLSMSSAAALLAACVFGLGGFVGNLAWPGMLSSCVWLPVIFGCTLDALTSTAAARRMCSISLAGLALGLVALAGGMQILFANALLIVGLCLYWRLRHGDRRGWLAPLLQGAFYATLIGATGLLVGAAQLLPTLEYGTISLRWVGAADPLPSFQKIPYHLLSSEAALGPRALLNLVLGGAPVGASEIAPYFGFLPLILAVIGVRRRWAEPLVPFLTVSAGLSLFYALGGYSLLHGVLYALLPMADKAREAGRFLYISHFCAAILAGYGMDVLRKQNHNNDGLAKAVRYLNISLFVLCLTVVSASILRIDVAESTYLSLLFAGGSIALLNGRRFLAGTSAGAAIIIALVLCDLYAFHRPIKNYQEESPAGTNLLRRVLDAGELAEFFGQQPGIFRVSIEDQLIRGMGDLYGIDTVNAGAASVEEAFYRVFTQVPRRMDLLNVRYSVTHDKRPGKVPAFAASSWQVYEHPGPCARAWIARTVIAVSSLDDALEVMRAPSFEPCRDATVLTADSLLGTSAARSDSQVEIVTRRPGYYELEVDAGADGLLVLSENHAPGWNVLVNGTPRELLTVDGTLQGVWLGEGSSRVVFRYRPATVYVGLGISLVAATLIGLCWLAVRRLRNSTTLSSGPVE